MKSASIVEIEKYSGEIPDVAPAVFKQPDMEELEDYEDYLDCFVTWKDLFYLESDDVPRTIASLGFRVPEVMDKAKFEKLVQIRLELRKGPRTLIFACDLVNREDIRCPLMKALHLREPNNRNQRMSTIIFIRDVNKKGHEVSGYMDFGDRLETDEKDWVDYYLSKKKLIPRSSDLGYFNWPLNFANWKDSPTWKSIVSVAKGVQLECKLDNKILNYNPVHKSGSDPTIREDFNSPYYEQCFILDYCIKKRKR